MQRQAVFWLDTDPGISGGANLLPLPDLTAEDASDQLPSGELLDSISIDMNSWSSILEETIANVIQSEINTDAGIQSLIEHTDQLEHRANNNLTDPTPPGASATSHLPQSGAPPTHFNTVPTIRPEHQPYVCSWRHPGSDTKCNHVAPDRSALLRHFGEKHQVSGAPDVSIVCQLLDSKADSACNTPIKRRNFPRHADIHYPVRYLCQHCPAGKSFSRQDSIFNIPHGFTHYLYTFISESVTALNCLRACEDTRLGSLRLLGRYERKRKGDP